MLKSFMKQCVLLPHEEQFEKKKTIIDNTTSYAISDRVYYKLYHFVAAAIVGPLNYITIENY